MADAPLPTGWSADRNWFWNGRQWNDAISPDGKWRFDGREWKSFHGQRTLMPAEPLYPPVAAAPALPAASAALPSWVAASEVERLDKEKRDRDELAAQAVLPQIPLPPERDWRRAGEHIQHSRPARTYSMWTGPQSAAVFVLLYLFCWPASFVFIWYTGWRITTKVVVALLSVVGPFLVVVSLVARGAV